MNQQGRSEGRWRQVIPSGKGKGTRKRYRETEGEGRGSSRKHGRRSHDHDNEDEDQDQISSNPRREHDMALNESVAFGSDRQASHNNAPTTHNDPITPKPQNPIGRELLRTN